MKRKYWRDYIREALLTLGGKASLSSLYRELRKIYPRPLAENWKSSVRATLELNSSDTDSYNPKNPDLFYCVHGVGKGVWGLRNFIDHLPQTRTS